MKLLIISHEYPPIGGGGANACFFLSREFARMGNEVIIVTAHFEDLSRTEKTPDGVLIHRVKCRRRNKEKSSLMEMLSYLFSAWKMAVKLEKAEKFDKCIVFFGIPSGPIALYLKYKYHLPYIVRFGGGDIPGAQKRFKLVYMVLNPVIKSIWKNADHLVANSQGLRSRAQKFETKYQIDTIENGVDSKFFVPDNTAKNKNVLSILFVSRLIEGKGLQFLIPDIPDMKKKIYQKCGKKIKLIVVGNGPYREKLELLTKKVGAADCVSFEGRKDKKQVRTYYQKADIFILPSLSEGMPNVVLEAMACGLPIIMTPCEGSKELVTDNGIISPIEEFADNLIKLCINSDLREKMGSNSLHNIKERFQWEGIAQRYMQLLEEN